MNASTDDMPEEDRYLQGQSQPTRRLCVHEWCDAYGNWGRLRDNHNLTLLTFYCKKCLAIRYKQVDRSLLDVDDDDKEIEV